MPGRNGQLGGPASSQGLSCCFLYPCVSLSSPLTQLQVRSETCELDLQFPQWGCVFGGEGSPFSTSAVWALIVLGVSPGSRRSSLLPSKDLCVFSGFPFCSCGCSGAKIHDTKPPNTDLQLHFQLQNFYFIIFNYFNFFVKFL